ncbi:DUF3088 domain-containing protein [Flexibacterium corallicola]|uniref:DUF3088 domain-containing protein n=1 Tax=Flexibacterium corallicola TaxID=3037259 RepID=UPI00286F33EA|nr:DUF3088 domain-containing protein [Pseudovibrio sp. M1P-2-3]
MTKDKDLLFLLEPGFVNPAYPNQRFYCWQCALIEGVLMSFPQLGEHLEVIRINWPKPRQQLIDLVGEKNQKAPLMVLREGETSAYRNGIYNGRAFINDKHNILAALAERHAFPHAHP